MINGLILWLLFGIAGVIWAQYCDTRDKRIQNEWKIKQGWPIEADPFEWDLIVV